MAFKFDPSIVPELPDPRPAHEIFVCSFDRVEGVHFRGGAITTAACAGVIVQRTTERRSLDW